MGEGGEGVGGSPEYPEKNLSEQGENQRQTRPTYDAGSGNRTQATLMGEGERGWEEDRSTQRKTSWSKEKTNNILNPHKMRGPGIKSWIHWWEARALITLTAVKREKFAKNKKNTSKERLSLLLFTV